MREQQKVLNVFKCFLLQFRIQIRISNVKIRNVVTGRRHFESNSDVLVVIVDPFRRRRFRNADSHFHWRQFGRFLKTEDPETEDDAILLRRPLCLVGTEDDQRGGDDVSDASSDASSNAANAKVSSGIF